MYLREQLYEDFSKNKVRKAVAECLINSAVFGTGIAEIVLEEIKEMKPATQPMMGGELQAIGVNIQDRTVCKLRPIMPQNFLIDPVANSIEEALGVAIDEFVPMHYIEQMQEKGVYKDTPIGEASPDFDLEADKDLSTVNRVGHIYPESMSAEVSYHFKESSTTTTRIQPEFPFNVFLSQSCSLGKHFMGQSSSR